MTAQLPIHPRTGLAALAVFGGRPVWPILGGSEPASEAAPAAPPAGVATAVTGPAPGAPAPIGTPAAGEVEGPRAGEDAAAFLSRVGADGAAKLALSYRKEAGDHRQAKLAAEQEKTTAAEQARQKVLDDLKPALVALGLVQSDETPDPAKLTTDLQAARAESEQQQLAARTLTIENAVLRQTVALGVDGDRLLDSRKFADTVAKLDPTDDAFGGSIKAAIEAAVKSDATLKTARAVAAAGMPHLGGSGGTPQVRTPRPLTEAVEASYNPTR